VNDDLGPYGYIAPVVSADRGFSVRQVLRVGRRHIRLFGICFVTVMVLGLGVIETLKPSYTATAFVAISPAAVDPLAPDGSGAAAAADADLNTPSTDASVMMSRDVADAVLTQIPPLPEEKHFSLTGSLCHAGLKLLCPKPGPTDPALIRQREIDGFLSTLAVLPEAHSDVIDVSVTAKTGERAAALADAVVSNYQRLGLEQQTVQANATAAWLNNRTAQLKQNWLDAVEKANAFSVANGLTNAGTDTSQTPLVDQQVADMANALGNAQAKLAAAQAQADALHDASAHGDPGALLSLPSQPILVGAASSLVQLESERGQLAAEFGPSYPKIQALDQQIAQTRASLNAQTGAALGSIGATLVASKAEVDQLTKNLDRLRNQSAGQSSEEAQFRSLTAEAISARTVYETFLEHSNDLVDRAALLTPPVSVVSHAGVPSTPTFPNKKKLGIAVLVLAIVAGTAAVFLKDFMAEGFEDADDLRAQVPLPLLASIPLVPSTGRNSIARHVLDAPFSRASDAVRGLAATLALLAGGSRARAVLVCSAGAYEGKSTLAVWLALTVRGGGHSVLVIDGDHRRGTLMQAPGAVAQRGLTDLLVGNAAPAEVVQTDPVTKLDFISPGHPMSGPYGGEEIARLRSAIAILKQSYSLIIIDSPPLLAMSDGYVLASVADQTVFVCRWQQTSRKAVSVSLDRLHSYGAKVAGIVVSMVDAKSSLAFGDEYGRRETKQITQLYGSEG
jgi:uncharacterized protein involved in exopolysaccharide biosynthesis/Mrp family chromosome partitioning ATPase